MRSTVICLLAGLVMGGVKGQEAEIDYEAKKVMAKEILKKYAAELEENIRGHIAPRSIAEWKADHPRIMEEVSSKWKVNSIAGREETHDAERVKERINSSMSSNMKWVAAPKQAPSPDRLVEDAEDAMGSVEEIVLPENNLGSEKNVLGSFRDQIHRAMKGGSQVVVPPSIEDNESPYVRHERLAASSTGLKFVDLAKQSRSTAELDSRDARSPPTSVKFVDMPKLSRSTAELDSRDAPSPPTGMKYVNAAKPSHSTGELDRSSGGDFLQSEVLGRNVSRVVLNATSFLRRLLAL